MQPPKLNANILPHSARRLWDEPVDTATTIVEQFGARGATMLGEAQAAAYFDGRLRRAGMKVSADGFRAAAWAGWDGTIVTIVMIVLVILSFLFPLIAVAVMGIAVFVVISGALQGKGPVFATKKPCQNIIGTRAFSQKTRRRVVLLAPLDAPKVQPSFVLAPGSLLLLRSLALGLVFVLGLVGLVLPQLRLVCWYFQVIPCLVLVYAAVCDWALRVAPVSPGAVNHAGALAALLASAEQITAADQTELWVIGLGASNVSRGLEDMMHRYPFERERTSFIVAEGIGAGELAFLSKAGWLNQPIGNPEMLRLVREVDAADPLINAGPHNLRFAPEALRRLHRRGWRALGLVCVGPDGALPYYGQPSDTPAVLDAALLVRAVRLVIGVVRALDAEQR